MWIEFALPIWNERCLPIFYFHVDWICSANFFLILHIWIELRSAHMFCAGSQLGLGRAIDSWLWR